MTVRELTETLANGTEIEIYQSCRTVFDDDTIVYVDNLVFKNEVGKIGKCIYFSKDISYMRIAYGVLLIYLTERKD